MALPKKRSTSSSKRRRASHFALSKPQLVSCRKCAKPIKPHRACEHCGTYKSREVISTRSKAAEALKEVKAPKEEKKEPTKKKAAPKKTAKAVKKDTK